MNYRPALRIALPSLFLCLLIAPPAVGQSVEQLDFDALTPPRAASDAEPNLAQVERQIIAQTNEFRQSHGLEPVSTDPALTSAAQYFADFMARTGKYGHHADGQRPAERAEEHGYTYCIVLENIAYRFSTADFTTQQLADGFVTGWKESPGHRKNMLDPDVTETGVAVAEGATDGKYYAVQMFGRPRSQSISFKITNRSSAEVRYDVMQGEQPKTFTLPPRYTRTHQRCRPAKLDFLFEQSDQIFTPSDDTHYIVTGNEGRLQIEKQDAQQQD